MEEIVEEQLTDAEVLAGILPSALNEIILRFTFKSHSEHIFATTKTDSIKEPTKPQEDKLGFLWVFDVIKESWVQIDLADIDSAVDEDSLMDDMYNQ